MLSRSGKAGSEESDKVPHGRASAPIFGARAPMTFVASASFARDMRANWEEAVRLVEES